MNIEERIELGKLLQDKHYFFRAFWDLGNPVIVDDTSEFKTAAVLFDKDGEAVNFVLNEDFWGALTDDSQLFVLCHEMLHVLLNHGRRFKDAKTKREQELLNVAADIVINEMLCAMFGFTRSRLPDSISKEGCWINTVFPDTYVEPRQSTEYYYNRLLKDNTDVSKHSLVDQHVVLDEEGQKKFEEFLEENAGILNTLDAEFLDRLVSEGSLSKELRDEILRAGVGTGGKHSVNAKKSLKKKWETVITEWSLRQKVYQFFEKERWERVNPRYSQILTGGLNLPSANKILEEDFDKNRIDVYFFLDTSGSCIHLKDRFFKAAKSLDPKKFRIKLFCFDTVVHELDIKVNQVYGGGGTSFHIIEEAIQRTMKRDKKKYPSAVWVVSDGYGNNFATKYPKRWFWFLTESHTTNCIPKESKIFHLKNYE